MTRDASTSSVSGDAHQWRARIMDRSGESAGWRPSSVPPLREATVHPASCLFRQGVRGFLLLGAGWPHPCAKARPPLPELVLFRGRGLPRTTLGAFGGEKRVMVTVDEQGNVLEQRT